MVVMAYSSREQIEVVAVSARLEAGRARRQTRRVVTATF